MKFILRNILGNMTLFHEFTSFGGFLIAVRRVYPKTKGEVIEVTFRKRKF